MKNFQMEYQKAVDAHPIPNDLFTKTKAFMRDHEPRSRKNRWGVLVPVFTLAVLGTVSAAAYGVYRFTQPYYQPRIKDSLPVAISQNAGAAVGKTDTNQNLSITILKSLCDNQKLYLSLKVKSTDGKPLQESSEFRKSQLMRQRFAQSTLKIDGKEYECNLFRTDHASVPDQASFELMATGDFTAMNGKSVLLNLKDFIDEVETCEDADFLFQNLGQLYASVTPEQPQNFIRTGLFEVYADKSLIAPSWTIPAGSQKIRFSNQFPNAYIDNVGFHKTGEFDAQSNTFYISIVPGSKSQIPELKKLCFQNLETMQPVPFEDSIITGNGIEKAGYSSQEEYQKAWEQEQNRKLSYHNGRVVIALSTFLDNGAESADCTVADLSRYRIVKNYKTETVVRYSGAWKIPFTLHFQDTSRSFTPNKSFQTAGGVEVTIQKISLSDISLSFSGKYKSAASSNDLLKSELSTNQIKLIRKDGSIVEVGQKIGGGTEANNSFAFQGDLQTVIEAREVTAIEIFGSRVSLE